ncbi:hypothetical protein TRIUR3_13841 [Triticum urartu]|uniref:Uncharacterized protein n=1 Tax=Triticum urartu TaxID=4572 RepID=M8AFE6_TRIUA|nr:hypothetical protein TRIUR3_13841 [Triticum urartu]
MALSDELLLLDADRAAGDGRQLERRQTDKALAGPYSRSKPRMRLRGRSVNAGGQRGRGGRIGCRRAVVGKAWRRMVVAASSCAGERRGHPGGGAGCRQGRLQSRPGVGGARRQLRGAPLPLGSCAGKDAEEAALEGAARRRNRGRGFHGRPPTTTKEPAAEELDLAADEEARRDWAR